MNLQKVERRSEVQQAALASEKPVMRQAKRMKDGLMNTDKIASATLKSAQVCATFGVSVNRSDSEQQEQEQEQR
ncbi:hypothetical protein TYRP_008041 [Tyrophagus putrescentiae]|nr:hypothetical protein TYRP_008041 [Tyrophagus putrescentiae]